MLVALLLHLSIEIGSKASRPFIPSIHFVNSIGLGPPMCNTKTSFAVPLIDFDRFATGLFRNDVETIPL